MTPSHVAQFTTHQNLNTIPINEQYAAFEQYGLWDYETKQNSADNILPESFSQLRIA